MIPPGKDRAAQRPAPLLGAAVGVVSIVVVVRCCVKRRLW
jgi:hypothetical protein